MKTLEPAVTVAVASLIQQFRRVAQEKADGLACRRDRELFEQLAETIREVQGYGQVGHIALKLLLQDDCPHVRRWVAPHVLSTGERAGLQVLLLDSALPGTCGEEAMMALRDWRAGRLTSPFGASEAGPSLAPLVAERRRTPRRTALRGVPERERRDRNREWHGFGGEAARDVSPRLAEAG